MKTAPKSNMIINTLNELYPDPRPPLEYNTPYTLLIAVLLSAQCTDKKVNQVMPSLLKLSSAPEDMANISTEKIQHIIKPCGLSAKKADAITRLSKILCDKYDGEVPRDIKLLEELPGVGHKTAAVVMAQAFGEPQFPVDTHIHRLATRWQITNGKNVVQTERDLKNFFPREFWNRLHLQIIFYGREYCPARSCFGKTCRICKLINFPT